VALTGMILFRGLFSGGTAITAKCYDAVRAATGLRNMPKS